MAELPFPVPPLSDGVILLRPWREADLPAKLAAFSDPVMRRFSWRTAPYTGADARNSFAGQEAARIRGTELNFALVEPDHPEVLLGGESLQDVRLDKGCASVGYWVAPAARGRGVATRPVRLLARCDSQGRRPGTGVREINGKVPPGMSRRGPAGPTTSRKGPVRGLWTTRGTP